VSKKIGEPDFKTMAETLLDEITTFSPEAAIEMIKARLEICFIKGQLNGSRATRNIFAQNRL